MKKFNASDLSKKPKKLRIAARDGGAIIQYKDRQGEVEEEFAMLPISKTGYIEGSAYSFHKDEL